MSNLSVISLLFQVLLAGAVIRRFGVGVSILFLPLAMFITSLWVLIGYGLVSILALKISDGAFRYSINKAGLELLYLPIPQEVKKKTKTFVDMFADRLARGVAGFLLLIFYTWLGLSVAQISLVSVALVGVWLVMVPALHPLLQHPSAEVRLKALNLLLQREDGKLLSDVETALTQEAQSYYELLSDHVRIAEAILRVLRAGCGPWPIVLAPESPHRRSTLELER